MKGNIKMTECLIKTLDTQNTKIYIEKHNNRYLLAECNAKIDIYRQDKNVNIMSSTKVHYIKYYMAIVLCGDVIYKQNITDDYFTDITGYEIVTEVLRESNSESIVLKNIDKIETDTENDWKFFITNKDDINRLKDA